MPYTHNLLLFSILLHFFTMISVVLSEMHNILLYTLFYGSKLLLHTYTYIISSHTLLFISFPIFLHILQSIPFDFMIHLSFFLFLIGACVGRSSGHHFMWDKESWRWIQPHFSYICRRVWCFNYISPSIESSPLVVGRTAKIYSYAYIDSQSLEKWMGMSSMNL